jgi:acyl-CoA thioesterase
MPSKHPFATTIGLHFLEAPRQGIARVWLEVSDHLRNPHGVLHGGVMFSMADTGMGAALYTLLGPGESCVTIEIKMNYLLPVTSGRLDCVSRVLNKNGAMGVIESEVRLGDALAATALGTFSIVRARG